MNFSTKKNEFVGTVESAKDEALHRASAMSDSVKRDAADATDNVVRTATELAETVSHKLKAVGVDTDVMANVAKGQASELQRLLSDELRAHPLRALGIAAAVGVFVGLLTTR